MSNRSAALSALVLSLVLIPTSSAFAWPAVDPAGHRSSLLGGRWTVALPESATAAVAEPPPGQPVARAELDGLVLLESEEGHFALHATLLESTRPDDFVAAVRALPAACASPTYGTIGDRTDVVAERCTEVSPDGAFRPVIVFAVHPDGWVDRIEGLIETTDPADEAARTDGAAYAEAVLATLESGTPPTGAVERGTVELGRACESGGSSDPLTITLPENWIAMRDTTESVTLLRMTRVVPLGAERPMVAIEMVPAGAVPQRVPEGVGVLRPGSLLDQPLDWLVIETDEVPTGIRRLSTELTVDCGGGATYARAISLSVGGPRATLDEGQHAIETLALGGTRGHRAQLEAVSIVEPAVDASALGESEEDRDAARQSHFWSIAIGAGSLMLLGAALVMRSKTTRPK